jgi:hypothetical protein
MVLRGQGAEPAAIRARQPRLVDIAERAVYEGQTLIEPVAIYRFALIEALRHEQLILADGVPLAGSLVTQHLAPARYIALMVGTIGAAIDERIAALMRAIRPMRWRWTIWLGGRRSVGAELCARAGQDAARSGHCQRAYQSRHDWLAGRRGRRKSSAISMPPPLV